MKLLKKRSIATIITIAVIILSTLFGAHRSLGAASSEVQDYFFDGVYDSSWGTTRPSIYSQLQKRNNAALGVYTIVSSYSELSEHAEALSAATQAVAKISHGDSVSNAFAHNSSLEADFNAAVSALESVELTASEKSNLDAYITTFRGAQSVIDDAGYNDSVRKFEREILNVFPTNLLKNIVNVDAPELFE